MNGFAITLRNSRMDLFLIINICIIKIIKSLVFNLSVKKCQCSLTVIKSRNLFSVKLTQPPPSPGNTRTFGERVISVSTSTKYYHLQKKS